MATWDSVTVWATMRTMVTSPVKECQENAASPVTCLKALTWATVAETLTKWTNADAEIPEVAICSNERQKVCILPSALKIEQYGSTKT